MDEQQQLIHLKEDVTDCLIAIRETEKHYGCSDYLKFLEEIREAESPRFVANLDATWSGVSIDWRAKICEWYFKMADHFQFQREIVTVALSYLDRFLAARKSSDANDATVAQLAALTSFHMAVKLNEHRRIKMSSLADLSRGHFTKEMMEQMELHILNVLNWHVHPTTPLQFVELALQYLNIDCSVECDDLFEVSRFLTELAANDYFFVTHKSSVVGFAAVLVALQEVNLQQSTQNILLETLVETLQMNVDRSAVLACRNRICEIYHQSDAYDEVSARTSPGQQSDSNRESFFHGSSTSRVTPCNSYQ